MRDTVYNFFRAVSGDGPDDGILRSGGGREQKRKAKADVISHNDKEPVSIQFRINIDVGEVQQYVRYDKQEKNPDFLFFNYVPHSLIVIGKGPPNVHEFIQVFEELDPSEHVFRVSLDTSGIGNYKNVESMNRCRIKKILNMNRTVNNIVIKISDAKDSQAILDYRRTLLSFIINAELTPEKTHGKSLF